MSILKNKNIVKVWFTLSAVTFLSIVTYVVVSVFNTELPYFISPTGSDDLIFVDIDNKPVWYFGELSDFPHTYTFTVASTTNLTASVLLPKNTEIGAGFDVGMLLVKKARRGVSEVARTNGRGADWETLVVKSTGDSYHFGPVIEVVLDEGEYMLEVQTPDNRGKYVLVLGEGNPLRRLSYPQSLSYIIEVKNFNEVGKHTLLLSPYFYLPITLFSIKIVTFFVFWYRQRRKKSL